VARETFSANESLWRSSARLSRIAIRGAWPPQFGSIRFHGPKVPDFSNLDDGTLCFGKLSTHLVAPFYSEA